MFINSQGGNLNSGNSKVNLQADARNNSQQQQGIKNSYIKGGDIAQGEGPFNAANAANSLLSRASTPDTFNAGQHAAGNQSNFFSGTGISLQETATVINQQQQFMELKVASAGIIEVKSPPPRPNPPPVNPTPAPPPYNPPPSPPPIAPPPVAPPPAVPPTPPLPPPYAPEGYPCINDEGLEVGYKLMSDTRIIYYNQGGQNLYFSDDQFANATGYNMTLQQAHQQGLCTPLPVDASGHPILGGTPHPAVEGVDYTYG
ncbi:MAG: hypothetical protein SFU25_00840 [Candidatus Caenarcaniphilales bacterium]|nr:hypothetical protein [Candidatus Caenarcaniphilales bacterium]